MYSQIEFSTAGSVTSGSENGRFSLDVQSNGSAVFIIRGEGNVAGARMGFFNTTPVAQQSVASDTLANLYTALRNYGLIA